MDEILLYGAHGIIASSPPLLQLRVCAAYASVLTHRTLRTLNLAKPQRMRFCCSHLQRRHGIMDDVMVLTLLYIGVFCPVKENIEIQATSFERLRPYRMNEASENGEVSAAIESMGKHGSINSYFYVRLSAQLLAQLPAFNTMKFLLSEGGSWNLIFYTGTDKYTYPFPAEEMEKLCTAHGIIIHH